MDETMNLNGMGIGGAESVNLNVTDMPVEKSSDILQEVTANIPESSEVSQDAPTIENEISNEFEPLNANNEFGLEDMDMIKELRQEEAQNRKKESIFSNMDFGPLKKYLEDDDVTDISYSNGGQLWLKTLSKGVYRVEEDDINDALIEKIAFQCSNVMGKTFNMAHPFLDSESAELRMNFIHDSIARNGIAVVFRKTPAKIRLEKEKLMKENYVSLSIHDFLIKAVQGHCNIIMCGETGSGKTEFLKYLASHTFENEKIVTVEDTLELHLDRIYPHRDIVAMKTNNVASYSDVLVTCMRQNPIWILLSEVRSAEAVTAVRNSISSGHFILSTIHADKAANIPYRLYSLLESNIDVEQFLNTIYRYVQIGVFLRGRFDPKQGRFVREIGEVTEFYVNDNNECISNTIYQKNIKGDVKYKPISEHLLDYLEGQGMDMKAIRDANGDLEKAQSYTDENKELEKIEEINTKENTEIVEKNEQKTEESNKMDSIANNLVETSTMTPQNLTVEPPSNNFTSIIEDVKQVTQEANPVEVITTVTQSVNPINENIIQPGPIIQEEVKPVEMITQATVSPTPILQESVKPIEVMGVVTTETNQVANLNNNLKPVIESVPPINSVQQQVTTPITSVVQQEEKIVPITQEQSTPQNINVQPLIEPKNLMSSIMPQQTGNGVNVTPINPSDNNQGNGSSSPVSFTPPNITNIQ